MDNSEQVIQKNPPRSLGIPTAPVPQTNLGTLEHTGLPFEPQDFITDVPPDFSWMASQWKYIDFFNINTSQNVSDKVYETPIVAAKTEIDYPYWTRVPFSFSKWWTGAISYRFTAIKPPRVTGKLLVVYRQDAFLDLKTDKPITDTLQRSIIKEWDLSQSSQFEFDLTGSVPIRARPSQWINPIDPFQNESELSMTVSSFYFTPWTEREMGAIQILVAQKLSPGGIFPDAFKVLVEKSVKTPSFMTPTDSRTDWIVAVDKDPQTKLE